jgi:polysaccharide export outer membrane protein
MRILAHAGRSLIAALVLFAGFGCKTPLTDEQFAAPPVEKLTLMEGDTIRIAFPGAPDLNTVQQIRRDGKVTLPTLGEFKAAGFAPAEMEKELLKAFGSQLVIKQVTVTMESGAFPVFISGAVQKPGRIVSDRPLTALQAIMESGGFTASANTKSVRVIRHEGEMVRSLTINLQKMLEGRDQNPFYLRASDIVFVPERFTWF